MAQMTEQTLVAQLQELVRGYSLNVQGGELSHRRRRIMRYHDGEPYGDEEDGSSKVVTREVLQTVRWSLPSLVRNCLTGRPVNFPALSAQDVEQAEQETDAVMHVMRASENAFFELHAFAYETLKYPNAYMRVYLDSEPTMQVLPAQTPEQVALFEMRNEDQRVTVVNVQPRDDGLVDALVRFPGQPRIKLEAIENEAIRVSTNATALNVDLADWVDYCPGLTDSDLVAMGYDPDFVKRLPTWEEWLWNSEKQTRRNTEDERRVEGSYLPGMQKREVHDTYVYVDFDGDGYAERRHVRWSGTFVLLNDYVDHQPFVSASCLPQPHRHVGMSQAEFAMVWQRVSSVITRGGLDNVYRVNAPRNIIDRNAQVNTDQLGAPKPYGWVETDDINGIKPEITPSILQQVLAAQDWIKEQIAAETGVSRLTTGIDANTLAKSTMGAYLEASGQATAIQDHVVRMFAESGIAGVARKIHHLLRTSPVRAPVSVEVKGEWIEVAPWMWPDRSGAIVNVGTGTGSNAEKIASTLTVLDLQREALPTGMTTASRIYNTLEDLLALVGKPSAARYFLDPESDEYQQVQAQREARAREEAEQAQRLATAQVGAAVTQAQANAHKLVSDAETNRLKAVADAGDKADKRAQDWAKLETEQEVDVMDRGLFRPDLRPVRVEDGR